MTRRVRLLRQHGLYAVVAADDGLWLCGFCTAENRALYLSWQGGWEVVP